MIEVIIEEMKEAYIEQVWELECASFERPWSRAALLLETHNPFSSCVVALHQGRVIGYVGMWHVVDEAHINNIAVLPEFRGQGCGKVLLEHILSVAKAKGIVKMTLEVRPSNEAAKELYARYGFKKVGIRPGYYENGEDAILMTLSL